MLKIPLRAVVRPVRFLELSTRPVRGFASALLPISPTSPLHILRRFALAFFLTLERKDPGKGHIPLYVQKSGS
jgi:hypothetical protein